MPYFTSNSNRNPQRNMRVCVCVCVRVCMFEKSAPPSLLSYLGNWLHVTIGRVSERLLHVTDVKHAHVLFNCVVNRDDVIV